MTTVRHISCIVLTSALSACLFTADDGGGDSGSDVSPRAATRVETVVGTAGPIGMAIAAAMAAAQTADAVGDGLAAQCVQVISGCQDYPCDSEVELSIGAGCPLPIAEHGDGVVRVVGHHASSTEATFDVDFGDVRVEGSGLVVVEGISIEARRTDDALVIEYSGGSVIVGDDRGAYVEGSDWTLEIDEAGTPGDPSDDTIRIDGDQGTTEPTVVRSVELAGVILDPSCRSNPIAGTAEVDVVSLDRISSTQLRFHEACDGSADIVDHVGIESTVELRFVD